MIEPKPSTPSLKTANISATKRKVSSLLAEWQKWQESVSKIVDQPYDRNTQLDVFADGENMMSLHESLQAKTLAYLNQTIENHGFLTGLDGTHIDRTDLRLHFRVMHRIEELKVLVACLDGISMVDAEPAKPLSHEDAWASITEEYGETKRAFGKKIGFVSDSYKRSILFRDIEQAFLLSKHGFPKPSVILAGSVLEELIRLYLLHKGEPHPGRSFEEYIKKCEDLGLLKSAIRRITGSVREFRNYVHLEKETSKKYSISRATARAGLSSIFMLANDL